MNWETMITYGDSITNGARSHLGYPEYLAAMNGNDKNYGFCYDVYNYSQNGFKALDLLKFISFNVSNIKAINADCSILLIGTNDTKGDIDVSSWSNIYDQLIRKILIIQGNKNLILLNIPLFPNGTKFPYTSQKNKLIDDLNLHIHNAAKTYGIYHLAIPYNSDFFNDGVHFNEYGSQQVANAVYKYILNMKGIDIKNKEK